MTNTRPTARAVGILFLSAFLLYGIGSSIAIATEPGAWLTVGVALMLLNTAAVIAIGVLMLPILRPHSPGVAIAYLATRTVEGALLAVGAIALLLGNADVNDFAYNVAMAILGIGSIFFCALLYSARLVPRFLAGWGVVGYALFATGCILELAGVTGAGIVGAAPGGLFEVVFAIWLIAKGFKSRAAVTAAAAPHPARV